MVADVLCEMHGDSNVFTWKWKQRKQNNLNQCHEGAVIKHQYLFSLNRNWCKPA